MVRLTVPAAPESRRRRRRVPEPEITVLLVDDHSLVRRGFRRMLEDDSSLRVVGEAEDGQQAVDLAAELRPRWW